MEKAVLIIYTGGTIGMINDPQTGSLYPFDFEQIEKSVPELKEFDFRIDSYTLPRIIDSSDVEPELWKSLCHIIKENYDRYHGFVILHGTDTMAYSASALSFMLKNLGKPVVFTGSQLPIGTIRTDGRENLIAALEIAAAYMDDKAIVPETSILFGDKLFRGNRTTKSNAESFDAFQSFNYPPLAEIGIRINYNYSSINYRNSGAPLEIAEAMNTNIAVVKIFPGINISFLDSILKTPGLEGVILETYGAGNAPSDRKFLDKLEEFAEKGILIYNVTQCMGGKVDMGLYKTSRTLIDLGVVSGYDITVEAAVCKMMHILGNYKETEKRQGLLKKCINGEISI